MQTHLTLLCTTSKAVGLHDWRVSCGVSCLAWNRAGPWRGFSFAGNTCIRAAAALWLHTRCCAVFLPAFAGCCRMYRQRAGLVNCRASMPTKCREAGGQHRAGAHLALLVAGLDLTAYAIHCMPFSPARLLRDGTGLPLPVLVGKPLPACLCKWCPYTRVFAAVSV